ncbi:MAG: family signal peptidase [Gemmataceae bacterium]|nr:family signal peptidase [Gemmataceae bacterium]
MTGTATTPAAKDPSKKKPTHPPDRTREAIETIVFVVVLVLLLKLFVTEAFVIPTGSMAETLYGYQKIITCPKCGHEFPVNSHDEVEGNPAGHKHRLVAFTCPNCRYRGRVGTLTPPPPNRTGDRVLVLKPIYHVRGPDRGDVVVFKYPEKPQDNHVAQNYIKRAEGFGGETLGIHRGDLYTTRSIKYPPDARDEYGNLLYPRPDNPADLWRGDPDRGPDYRYPNNKRAMDLFDASRRAGFPVGKGGFEIVRKTEAQVLACQRIVWDNDQQPKDLAEVVPPRWYPEAEGKWNGDSPRQPRLFVHKSEGMDWIRYRHLPMVWKNYPADPFDPMPQTDLGELAAQPARPVDNFLGYNNGVSEGGIPKTSADDERWVGDLLLECEAEIETGAEVVLELSKGVSRFRATFADGRVVLSRTGPGEGELAARPCKVKDTGKYKLRFANVDCRLWVWVNDRLIDFGTDGDYSPASTVPPDAIDSEGYTRENDIAAPASIGAKGPVTVRAIKLHRDIYYTRTLPTRDAGDHSHADLYYVHPDHYLCLGDNSAQSSDSRKWGLVPDRLMLGKAVFVFFPIGRVGFIK